MKHAVKKAFAKNKDANRTLNIDKGSPHFHDDDEPQSGLLSSKKSKSKKSHHGDESDDDKRSLRSKRSKKSGAPSVRSKLTVRTKQGTSVRKKEKVEEFQPEQQPLPTYDEHYGYNDNLDSGHFIELRRYLEKKEKIAAN